MNNPMQTGRVHGPRVVAAGMSRRTVRADRAPAPAVGADETAKGLNCIEYLPALVDLYFCISIKRCNTNMKTHAI
ncbi:MAG: hypothetical protein V4679_06130 [Pseudomonadota bacterium]